MADLQETSQWEAGIYQLETTDEVMGGENGIDNLQAKQLANRTLWLKNQLKQGTEAVLGLFKVATQAEVDAGALDTGVVTPKKLRYGFAASLTATGYIAFPSWLGGLVLQWGTEGTGHNGDVIALPVAFPNSHFVTITGDNASNHSQGAVNFTLTGFTFLTDYTGGTGETFYFFSIGR